MNTIGKIILSGFYISFLAGGWVGWQGVVIWVEN